MSFIGLLIVSNAKQLGKTLRAAERYVDEALYVYLNIPGEKVQPVPTWGRLISQIYADSQSQTKLNMQILIGPLKMASTNSHLRPIERIIADPDTSVDICSALSSQFNIAPSKTLQLPLPIAGHDLLMYQNFDQAYKTYNTVVLGGTFDRIHVGHKIFLSQAVLRAVRRLVVGVTTAKLTKSKVLAEFILPVDQRIKEVRQFLMTIDPTLQYDVVPIDDPFGPTQSDPDMDLIMVSAETLRGGQKVNEIREKNKLRPLEIFCIQMVESSVTDGPKEAKVSSSNTRLDMLGTRLRPIEARPHLPKEPYIIGLTGGIASGKSKMAQRFQKLGAAVLNCDQIGHEVYEPGQACFDKVVEHFGKHIVNANGHIDRKQLGSIVFGNPQKLKELNSIVWPELMLEVKRRILHLHQKEHPQVIILEAAVLLMAGWENECHEVWSMIVPPEVAIKRVMERNGLSEEEARKRRDSQWENSEVVAKSNVVFSSQWDDSFTQQQAERAWNMLMQELNKKSSSML